MNKLNQNKSSPEPCQCCLSPVLSVDPLLIQSSKLYIDLIYSCFSIKVSQDKYNDSNPLLCALCVQKLKYCHSFKCMILESQKNLSLVKVQVIDADKTIKVELEDSSDSVEDVEEFMDDLCPRDVKVEAEIEFVKCAELQPKPTTSPSRATSSKESLPESTNSSILTCKFCSKTFTSKSVLSQHMGIHRFVQCPICKETVKRAYLSRHVRCHTDNRIYACPWCSERFRSLTKRLFHLRDVHDIDINKHKCEVCSKTFYLKGKLTLHIKKEHHNEMNAVCHMCGYRCFSKGLLRGHMLKHIGEKTHECDVCHKSYVRRKTLIEHLKIHNSYKALKCPICDRGFTQKCSLKGHLLKVHKLESLEQLEGFRS